MHTSLTYHHNYVADEFTRAAQRDTKRQEAILFLIALLQLFALISVLVDYQTLHGITQNAQKLLDPGLAGWEWWGLQHIGNIPRLLLVLAIILGIAFYGPIFFRYSKKLLSNGVSAISNRFSSTLEKLRQTTRFIRKRLIIKRSSMHGLGIFPLFRIRAGETLLRIQAGTPKKILSEEDKEHEWNYYQGTYYLRPNRTPYGYINHSRTPNTKRILNVEGDTVGLELVAIKDIGRKDEILIDYRKENLPFEYIRDAGGYL